MFGLKNIKRNKKGGVFICKINKMEGKLVKTGNDYVLYSNDNSVLGITSGTMVGRMLSLKNCQAIEVGYDVIDLAEKNSIYNEEDWASGFLKAMEIIGDKKFDMNDIALAFSAGIKHGVYPKKPNTTEYAQSLLINEWNVEVEQELIQSSIQGEAIWELKLDTDGCLILKRI